MKEVLERFIKQQIPLTLDRAKVISVNETHCKVQSITNDKTFFKCSLNAVLDNDDNELKVVPVVGSIVVIACFDRSAAILQTSKVESFKFKFNDIVFEINADGFEIKRNGQSFKNIVENQHKAISDLCDAVNAIIVNPGYGVNPNVAVITAIKTQNELNKENANQIFK